jgi:glycosyltransferase involved in cell wall biosynthesis
MPVYNGESYLRMAVRSLLRQTLRQIEIIIVNDGSTDGTEQILDELATDARVRPLQLPRVGIPRARNTGIALARAQYIAVHDADDLSLPDRLAKQYAFLEQSPDVAAVGSFAIAVDETGQFTWRIVGIPTGSAQIGETLSMHNCLIHGTLMMRTSAVEAVGKYREAFAFAHDYDLYLRLAEHFQLTTIPEVLYLYRSHAESVSSTHKNAQRAFARIARELAKERRQTGSDLLEREGVAAFLSAYEMRLQEPTLPEKLKRAGSQPLLSVMEAR